MTLHPSPMACPEFWACQATSACWAGCWAPGPLSEASCARKHSASWRASLSPTVPSGPVPAAAALHWSRSGALPGGLAACILMAPGQLQNGHAPHADERAAGLGLPKSALSGALSQNLDEQYKAKARLAVGPQRGWLRIDARGNITTVQVWAQPARRSRVRHAGCRGERCSG